MNFDEVIRYSKDADTVMRMFADRDYFEKKYAETTISYEVLEHEFSDQRFRIKCRLKMPSSAPIPGFAKKFLGETMTVVQEDIWELDSRTGRLNVEVSGAPVTVAADMKLVDGADGAENHLHWTVQCKVPLVGGKIEKLIADDIKAKTPKDREASEKLLQNY